jgi:hypothetical protein
MPLPAALPRPDAEDEEEVIRRRLAAAQEDFKDKIMAQSLKCVGKLVAQSQGYASWHDEPRVFYRVTHERSHTFFDKDIGFCCYRWVRQRNFTPPSCQDFKDHMEGKDFNSPYISLTESPCHALRYGNGNNGTAVYVIDAVRLRATKIHTEQSTVLATEFGVPSARQQGATPYITKTQWLAEFWVPAECIVKELSMDRFKEICGQNQITNSMSAVRTRLKPCR